ncbi:MAG: hypothetical protein JNL90_03055 [Planctomycetes bacterium]|nr:hypothetical protein [Planctomycetota bacterium]
MSEALRAAAPRPEATSSRDEKKNYAQRLSRELAALVAGSLRSRFEGILPSAAGEHHESRARSSRGMKKLDVNYSTVQLGLGLGVSIKTVTHPDPRSGKFSKNYTRIDNELRAEASDYHERQPYAVLVALVFIPRDACADATPRAASSFGAAVKALRPRNHRTAPEQKADRFERIFIGLYVPEGADAGECSFFDVDTAPPWSGTPAERDLLSYETMISEVESCYDQRNAPPFRWADDT